MRGFQRLHLWYGWIAKILIPARVYEGWEVCLNCEGCKDCEICKACKICGICKVRRRAQRGDCTSFLLKPVTGEGVVIWLLRARSRLVNNNPVATTLLQKALIVNLL